MILIALFVFSGSFDAMNGLVWADSHMDDGDDEMEAPKKKRKRRKRRRRRRRKKKMEEDSEGMGYETPYGMAGCGLWTMVLKDKSMGSQLGVYALRNLILNSQTSAITTGTSNCVAPKSDYAKMEKEVFVTINLNSLSKEAAQGDGVHLRSFAQVLGCSDYDAFAKMSQSRYNSIFSTDKADGVLQNYLFEVQADKNLAKNCQRAG